MKILDLEHNFEDFSVFVTYNHDKLFRVWLDSDPEDMTCDYYYIVGTIKIPNDIMLLCRSYDDRQIDNKYEGVSFFKLSEITLAYYEDDQED